MNKMRAAYGMFLMWAGILIGMFVGYYAGKLPGQMYIDVMKIVGLAFPVLAAIAITLMPKEGG